MNTYFVYHSEKFQGPFTTEEIASLLRQNKVSVQEYLYDMQFRCIFQIGEIEDFKSFLPLKPPQLNANDDYIIYKNHSIEGPFTKDVIAEMLKHNKLIAFDYITLWGGSNWAQIKDVPIFKNHITPPPEEKFLNFGTSDDMDNKVNTIVREDMLSDLELTPGVIRKYPRTPYSASTTIVHNNKSYVGKCTTLAVGGCFVQTQTGNFNIGDEIMLVIKADTIKLDIEVKARVTSLNEGNLKGVGLQFLNLSNEFETEIQKFVNRYISMIKKREG